MSYYTKEQAESIEQKRISVDSKCDNLLLSYNNHHFLSEHGLEFARHGYMRRLSVLRRCIENVFKLVPVEQAEVPIRPILHDATINIQAFFANVYGSVDNLAWIWVYERNLADQIGRHKIGLRKKHKEVRATLSESFRCYLQTLDSWLDYVVEYRDALAHRIPLYIPPGAVPPDSINAYNSLSGRMIEALYTRGDVGEYDKLDSEQKELLVFQPLITHSATEATMHMAFHVQMLADFLTVEELGYKLLDDLNDAISSSSETP